MKYGAYTSHTEPTLNTLTVRSNLLSVTGFSSAIAGSDVFPLSQCYVGGLQLSSFFFRDCWENDYTLSLCVCGRWYRGKIAGVFADVCQVDVFFVDYGDSEFVGYDDIIRLPICLRRTPFQAIECTCLDMEPLSDEWTDEACDLFFDVVYNQTFDAKVYWLYWLSPLCIDFDIIACCPTQQSFNHRQSSFSVRCCLTVEHSSAERHIGVVNICFHETFEDPSLPSFFP